MKRNMYCIPCALEERTTLALTLVDGDPVCAACALAAAAWAAPREPETVGLQAGAADDVFPSLSVSEKVLYCRWSDDNFSCQLYCYEDRDGGYATHVIARRPIGDVPQVTALLMDDPCAFMEQVRAQIDFMLGAQYELLDLPFAGESFHDATLPEFRVRLDELRRVGYRFPQRVLDRVDGELAPGGAAW
ncbi:MAG: hypothetical protein M3O02_00925 [Acidobacteriota bacterium]|nr:hypothetical protein [Acidobacteriota bacterium]